MSTPAGHPSSAGRPDTVVFDLGGVLVDWDPRYLYRRLLPEPEVDTFLDEIGFADWNHAQDAGRSWAEGVAELVAAHPHQQALIEAYPARYPETMRGAIDGTVTILRALHRRGVRLVALTNWSAETFPHARAAFGFLDLFDGVVVSGEEGLAKPDPRIFATAAERYRLEPARTTYVDDSSRNVAAARGLGFDAVLFTDPETLRDDLIRRGLLDDAGSG